MKYERVSHNLNGAQLFGICFKENSKFLKFFLLLSFVLYFRTFALVFY